MKDNLVKYNLVRVKTLLYNAISLLADKTFEEYDDSDEWIEMVLNELGTTKEELDNFGIVLNIETGIEIKESEDN